MDEPVKHALMDDPPNLDGDEVITGDWLFDRGNLRVGSSNQLAIGLNATAGTTSLGLGPNAKGNARSVSIGPFAGTGSSGNDQVLVGEYAGASSGFQNHIVAIGKRAGSASSVPDCIYLGMRAGASNNRANRLIIDSGASAIATNLVDPLIDGRFRGGTDSDSFAYSKGVKINGHLETTDQLILHSPDGSRWAVTVDNDGNLSTEPATEGMTP